MAILSDPAISELIAERKPIPDGLWPVTRWNERNRHWRREYEITCEATGNIFVVKLRKNQINQFDFSVILGYQLPALNTIFNLRRYNGKSHPHTNHLDENVTFRTFHIHTATERYQDFGSNPEHFAQITTLYVDMDGAIQCMLADCGFRVPMDESPLFAGEME
jgi:hypothetical protein